MSKELGILVTWLMKWVFIGIASTCFMMAMRLDPPALSRLHWAGWSVWFVVLAVAAQVLLLDWHKVDGP